MDFWLEYKMAGSIFSGTFHNYVGMDARFLLVNEELPSMDMVSDLP